MLKELICRSFFYDGKDRDVFNEEDKVRDEVCKGVIGRRMFNVTLVHDTAPTHYRIIDADYNIHEIYDLDVKSITPELEKVFIEHLRWGHNLPNKKPATYVVKEFSKHIINPLSILSLRMDMYNNELDDTSIVIYQEVDNTVVGYLVYKHDKDADGHEYLNVSEVVSLINDYEGLFNELEKVGMQYRTYESQKRYTLEGSNYKTSYGFITYTPSKEVYHETD